jgi:hydrogenase expression/formation protein HypE
LEVAVGLSARDELITMKYGAGGRAMRALIQEVLQDGLAAADHSGEITLRAMDDGAALRLGSQWLVMSTDSHVVQPLFFPGGDIGRLAVSGTVNDLAMMGATDVMALTCAVILEEGFSRAELARIQRSIRDTCGEAGARIVTGDTKVMGKGEIDGIIINTTGVALTSRVVPDNALRAGDRIIVTGSIGDHGMAVMAERLGLAIDGKLESDVAPINALVRIALDAAPGGVVAMKDPTRGGVASALHEMAEKSGVGVIIDELAVPVSDAVRAASELLGIDPLHVANEGKAVMGVRPEAAAPVLAALQHHPLGRQAALIGSCTADRIGAVILDTGFGRRLVTEPEGEPLPRIC